MSLRFRRSVRLFPGVRLNFSASGVSTTVGVRGASMTLGSRGTYVNAGLPGTGISYRTKISAPAARSPAFAGEAPARPPIAHPPIVDVPREGVVEIKSADVSALTSPGLGELKRLINEAAIKRRQLTAEVASDRQKLEAAAKRLRLAQTFIIRIFTQRSVPRLADAVEMARCQLDVRVAELEGCIIEVDFAFDDASHGSYAALIRAFESLSSCHRIWDVTTVQATDRVRERTVASTTVSRTLVSFDFVAPEIVKSSQQAMRMGNASGRYVYLYPGFLMMRDGSGDFALIEYNELHADFTSSRFIETEGVPPDTEVVGQTWRKANKDGSPDRRFNDNYAIPIVRYGELVLRSPTGLLEAYQFSDFEKASMFSQAIENHRRALTALGQKGGAPISEEISPDPEEPEVDEAEVRPVVHHHSEPKGLALDWAALLLIVLGLGWSGFWLATHPVAGAAPPPPVVATQPAPAADPPKLVHKHRKNPQASAKQPEAGSAELDSPAPSEPSGTGDAPAGI